MVVTSKNKRKRKGSSGEKKKKFSKEEIQLIWFFIIVLVVFASFAFPYLYMKSLRSFEYSEINWTIENLQNLEIYHGVFPSIANENLTYNLYFRNDPRENNVSAEGNFNKFRYGGWISLGEGIETCRGEVSRMMVDLGSFLKIGVGVGQVTAASTNLGIAKENNLTHINCTNAPKRTVVIIERNSESKVIQFADNPNCYIISVKDCNDISAIERFIVKTVSDFRKGVN